MKASCKCETILKGLEEAAAIAGGVEEVVDGVEEEDEEAQDRQHGIRVHRVPGQQMAVVGSHKSGIRLISYT